MKIFAAKQVKIIDKYTIENEPIASIDLMERAGRGLTDWIADHYYFDRNVIIFIGPGNNGGDGLVVSRLLSALNFKVTTYLCSKKHSPDALQNLDSLKEQGKAEIKNLDDIKNFPGITEGTIIIDALFGSGLSRPLEGFPAEVVKMINKSNADIIAVDIPSGMLGEDNRNNNPENIIKAKYTLSFQFPKLSFFYPEHEQYTGQWHIIDIGLHPKAIAKNKTPYYYISNTEISERLKKRKKFSHKGHFGHALLISGSYGKMGAALLGTKACLKAGCGLVTCHIPKSGYHILQTGVPEAMVSIDTSDTLFTNLPDLKTYKAIGIGPGIGTEEVTQKAMKKLLDNNNKPMVIDADGLNILSANKEWLKSLPRESILTPHPKEFERLAGETTDHYSRLQLQREFSKTYNVYVVLKGAYTSITNPDGTCFFNSTGNPGMATGGSGDVLTGIILSLLCQGYSPESAAITGTYIHGLSGDMSVTKSSEESLIASDIIKGLGNAFNAIRKGYTMTSYTGY